MFPLVPALPSAMGHFIFLVVCLITLNNLAEWCVELRIWRRGIYPKPFHPLTNFRSVIRLLTKLQVSHQSAHKLLVNHSSAHQLQVSPFIRSQTSAQSFVCTPNCRSAISPLTNCWSIIHLLIKCRSAISYAHKLQVSHSSAHGLQVSHLPHKLRDSHSTS
jgi:hypothetical protein